MARNPSPTLAELLELQADGPDTFSARHPAAGGDRAFGGHLLAQALVAAARTAAADRLPHSLHARFLRPGVIGQPVVFTVDRLRDGRAFSARLILVRQGDRVLASVDVSLHTGEQGRDWQAPAPAPGPVPSSGATSPLDGTATLEPFQVRGLQPWRRGTPVDLHPFWIRAHEDLGDAPVRHLAALVLVSDLAVSGTAAGPGLRMSERRPAVSLDHAVWFHRPVRMDEWMLVDIAPVSVADGRGLAHGRFVTEAGQVLATVVQEAVLRSPGETEHG